MSKLFPFWWLVAAVAYHDVYLEQDITCGCPLDFMWFIIDGDIYSPRETASLSAGDHTLEFGTEWCVFKEWQTTGDISVEDPSASSTTLTVDGDGTLEAVPE